MTKDNHTSLINADQKLIVTLNGATFTLLGRSAQVMRALIRAQHEPVSPDDLIRAMGLTPAPITSYKTPERLTVYKYIGQLQKQFPELLYCLKAGRGWRISRALNPRIVFDSQGT